MGSARVITNTYLIKQSKYLGEIDCVAMSETSHTRAEVRLLLSGGAHHNNI